MPRHNTIPYSRRRQTRAPEPGPHETGPRLPHTHRYRPAERGAGTGPGRVVYRCGCGKQYRKHPTQSRAVT